MQLSSDSKYLFQLVQKHVYQFRTKPFRLASGKESQHYFNCKKITMIPDRLQLLARVLRDELIPHKKLPLPQAAGGLTLGADPIAYALSLAYWQQGHLLYPVVVRKEAKSHGMAKRIEAEFDKQLVTEILVLEDTMTTGNSALVAVQALREAGFNIKNCIAIIDREEGGYENLAREGVGLISLFQGKQFWNKECS